MKPLFLSLLLAVALTSCTNYGKKVKSGNVEVYYKDGVSEDQAKKAADLIYNAIKGAGSGSSGTKSYQLTKATDTLLMKMVVDIDKANKMGDEPFYQLQQIISDSVFNGAPLNLSLTDDTFKSLKYLAYKKPTPPEPVAKENDFGTRYTNGNVEVYANGEIGNTLANDLAAFLSTYFHPEATFSFQLSKNDNNDFVVNMASDPSKVDRPSQKDLTDLCTKLSNEVLNGSPLIFQLTDLSFKPLRTFAYPTDAVPAENSPQQ